MKNSFKNILLLLTSLIICLIFAEFTTKTFFPQNLIYYNDDVWKPDSLFGWRHYANANTMINTGGAGLKHFVTDENGYRINKNTDDAMKSKDYVINILVLGDSFLEALQVENEETIPQFLKQDMLLKYDLDVNFYNSAVGGWNPNHYYLETKKVLQEKTIDLGIVFLYVANDIVKSIHTSYKPRARAKRHKLKIPHRLSWSDFKYSIFYPINDFFEVKSHLFIFIKQRMRPIFSKISLTAYYFPDLFYLEEKSSNRWEITTQICKNIHDKFTNLGIPIVFILLPPFYQCDEKVFYEYVEDLNIPLDSVDLEQPNKLLAQYFKKYNIDLYDPLDFMRKKTNSSLNLYGNIDEHLNAEGHCAIAEYLLPIIVEKINIRRN